MAAGVPRRGTGPGLRFVDLPSETLDLLWEFVHDRASGLAAFLCTHSSFGRIELDVATDLALATRVCEFSNGQVVYAQDAGVEGDAVYVVYGGSVVLESRTPCKRKLALGRVGLGGVLGGGAMVAGLPHAMSAIADGSVVCLEIDRGVYAYLQATKPRVARAIARAVVTTQSWQLSTLFERVSGRA